MNLNLSSSLQKLFFCFIIIICNHITVTAQTAKKLDSLYSTLYKQGSFNGCVLIAENGKPTYEKAFGYANFDTKQPLTNQTMFELASVSKQFTAMAIMQLHQKGKLKYDDSLNKYFPQISYHGITINHLLHHTSGIGEFLNWNEKLIDMGQINYNKDILASLIKNKPPLGFKPGDQLSYSNTNYVLLALIVEKISGMAFGDYMDKYIFKPLKMTHTRIYAQRAATQKINDYAFGYVFNPVKNKFVINDSLKENRYEYYFDGISGPYGISSDTEDMLKWDQALYTDQLVTKQEQAAAYIPSKLNNGKSAELGGLAYGFGWLIPPVENIYGQTYLHTGGYPGYQTMIVRCPDKNKTIIILTNTWNTIDILRLGLANMQILFDEPFEIPKAKPYQKSVMLNAAQLKAIEGTYSFKSAPNIKIVITSDGHQAYAQATGQVRVEIYSKSELEFFYTAVEANIKFVIDNAGIIKKLTLFQNGQQLEANKE